MSFVVKNGFEVSPHTDVIISEQWPTPRPELVDFVRWVFNNDSSIKLIKHVIARIVIDRYTDPTGRNIGEWCPDTRTLIIADNPNTTLEAYQSVMVHEIDGHCFFDWAVDHRKELLDKFCALAEKTPPITDYIQAFEKEWRADYWRGYNGYVNEQHSAIAEIHQQLCSGLIDTQHTVIQPLDILYPLIHAYMDLHHEPCC